MAKWVLDTSGKEEADAVYCKASCTQCTTPGNVDKNDFILAGYLYKKDVTTGTDGTCSTLSCLADQKIVTDPPLQAQSTNTATCQASGHWDIIPTAATKATCAISCAECSTPFSDAGYIAPTPTTTFGACDALQECHEGEFSYKHAGDSSYSTTKSKPECVNNQWIISGEEATHIGCEDNYCNRPLPELTTYACPNNHVCRLLLERKNNNDKFMCQMDGDLIFGHNGNANGYDVNFVQCKPNQKDWHPQGDGFNPGPKATCKYDCGSSCNKLPKLGRSQVKIGKDNGCDVATCSDDQQLVGYADGNPSTAIGSATCLDDDYDNKWLSDSKMFFDSVDCYSTESSGEG